MSPYQIYPKLEVKQIHIHCADNTTLAGSIYQADYIKGAVLIAPATGIKRQFYHHFATWLAEHGYATITYDNQGIGDSLKGSIKLCPSSLVSWGQIDQTAALERLISEFPNTTYQLVGHSAGGQLVGLMDNCEQLKSMFNVACSSGSLRNLKGSYKLKAYFFMYTFIPMNNLLLGYTNTPTLNMGEPLPKKVAAQWSEWCRHTGYVANALGKEVKQHHYNDLKIPSMWVNAIDDDIAVNENVDDMTRVFKNISVERLILNPQKENTPEIGHMKFFSRNNSHLWKYALRWLDRYN